MRRALLLAACVAAGLAASASAPEPAGACSCVPPDPEALLAQADGAFTGRLLGRDLRGDREAVHRFAVERALKGTLPPTVDVWSSADGASCGLELGEGQRIGLVLSREGGRWRSGLCHQVDAAALAAAATPGSGRIASGEDAARGFGRVTALAAAALGAAAAGLFLIRRRYRPD